jgi:hypothetical protein
MAPPVGYKKEPTIAERIRTMVRGEAIRQAAEAAGAETFEEADDFEISDETYDPTTPYEEVFDPGREGSGAQNDNRRVPGVTPDIAKDGDRKEEGSDILEKEKKE